MWKYNNQEQLTLHRKKTNKQVQKMEERETTGMEISTHQASVKTSWPRTRLTLFVVFIRTTCPVANAFKIKFRSLDVLHSTCLESGFL